jgi:transposase
MQRPERLTMHTGFTANASSATSPMEEGSATMHYLGIDWADEKHDGCLLAADGRVLSRLSIAHDLTGFQKLSDLLTGLDDVSINLERSDGLLVDWLSCQPWPVYVTQPVAVHHRRPRRSKDDRGDAYLLAHLLRVGDPECRPLLIQGAIVLHLKQLTQAYDSVLREQRRLANRLIYLLKQYYPAALNAFAVPHSAIMLDFLERFPTPETARAASPAELGAFLHAHRYRAAERKAAALYQRFHQPAPHATVQTGLVEHVYVLLPLLKSLYESRNDLGRHMEKVFASHPEAGWWKSLPGLNGPLTAPRLLAWIGDNRERFPSPQVLQAIAGTAPVTRRSGKQLQIEFRTACCHELRKAMDDMARQSVKHSGWAAAYVEQQHARGRSAVRAYRALANRWLSIIWKLWKTRTPYDEQVHIRNRSHQGHAEQAKIAWAARVDNLRSVPLPPSKWLGSLRLGPVPAAATPRGGPCNLF